MAHIQLSYKLIIDSATAGDFEQNIFRATYEEFLIKSRPYNPGNKIRTFTALKAKDGCADALHYKISLATGHLIDGLNKKTPTLTDNNGNAIPFDIARFKLLESDIFEMSTHQIAIEFITQPLTLCATIGEYLVLARGEIINGEQAETFTIKMQPNLSVVSYQLHDANTYNAPMPLHY